MPRISSAVPTVAPPARGLTAQEAGKLLDDVSYSIPRGGLGDLPAERANYAKLEQRVSATIAELRKNAPAKIHLPSNMLSELAFFGLFGGGKTVKTEDAIARLQAELKSYGERIDQAAERPSRGWQPR